MFFQFAGDPNDSITFKNFTITAYFFN